MHKDTIQKYRDFIGPNPLFDHLITQQPTRTKHKPIHSSSPLQSPKKSNQSSKNASFAYTETPHFINGTLRDYQLEGVNWLIQMHTLGINCVLADEMGLGKTLQTITFLGYLKESHCKNKHNNKHEHHTKEYNKMPHLLIVPKSTLHNWKSEFARFYPRFKVYILHCARQDAKEERKKLSKIKIDVVITTYEMCINTKVLNHMRFHYLVIDEAHRIKNEQSRLSVLVREYKAKHRMLITGTPLQNNVRELWALLNFLVPELFRDGDVFEAWIRNHTGNDKLEDKNCNDDDKNSEIVNNDIIENHNSNEKVTTDNKNKSNDIVIKRRKIENNEDVNSSKCPQEIINEKIDDQNSDAVEFTNVDKQDVIEPVDNGDSITQLRRVIMPFFLRREKREVEASLLPKKIINLYPQLTEMQRLWYKNILRKDLQNELNIRDKTALMNVVCQLRKVCNHPYLFDGAEPEPFTTGEHLVTNSAKMIYLDKLLHRCKENGNRVLIFSQMSRMLDILEDYCLYREYTYRRLDGSTATEERISGIEEFNTDSGIFIYLLTTRAGGLGINLTAADTVIIYDSDWNPQMDLQAMDRAHRIGQKNEVKVYRLILENTIEEKILERCMHKLKLDECLMKKKTERLDKNELLNIIATGFENFDDKNNSKSINKVQSAEVCIDDILIAGEKKTADLNTRINGIDFNETTALDLYKWEGEDYKKRVRKLEEIVNQGARNKKTERIFYAFQFYPPGTEELFRDVSSVEDSSSESNSGNKNNEKDDIHSYKKDDHYCLKKDNHDRFEKEYAISSIYNLNNPNNPKPSPSLIFNDLLNSNTNDLTSKKRQKKEMLSQGFDWDKKDFNNYIKACETVGKDIDRIINHLFIINQTPEKESFNEKEVRRYHKIFWERKSEIPDNEKIIQNIEKAETKRIKRETINNILKRSFGEKIEDDFLLRKKVKEENFINLLENLKLTYTQNTKSKFYTEVVDKTLLFLYFNLGSERIRRWLIYAEVLKHDYYVLTRDDGELGKRIGVLTGMLIKNER
ncbi:chromatin remodeling complex Adenosinetriphosphatase [Conglomerata obtusa]